MNLDERIKSILLNLDRNQLTDASLTYDEATAVFKQLIEGVLEYVKPEDWDVEVVRSRRSGGKQIIETAVKTEGSEHIFEIPLDRYDDFVRVKVVRKSMEARIKELGL